MKSISSPSPSSDQPTLQRQKLKVDDGLSIGAVTIRLGTPRDTTLSMLGSYFLLQKLPDAPVGKGQASSAGQHIDELWLIQNKSNPDEAFGQLGFGSGKLTWASKEWTPENKQYGGAETAEIIYKIINGFEASGATNCEVKTFSSLQRSGPGGLEFRETRINCGVRHLEINLIWQSGPGNIEINEVLGGE